jgi:catechol 2,3-dioxygenase-like lactoylglutathione lyase family enzyme
MFGGSRMLADRHVIAFVTMRQADRTKHFHGQVLGLRLVADTPFALAFDARWNGAQNQKVTDLTPALAS